MPDRISPRDKSYQWGFWIILCLLTLFRLFYIRWGPLDLSPDEAHYWEWSRHLDLSYYSKGPLVALIIFFLTSLGEHSAFFIRLGAVIISAGASLVLFNLARVMFKSARVGFFAALLPHLTLLFSAGSLLMTIDPPFLLFWGLTISCFYRALKFNRLYWYVAGLCFGLGFLSKFTMALFLPLAFLFLRFHRRYRFWLRRREPYLALAIGAVLCYPVLLWNARHHWVTFRHLLGQAHSSASGFRLFLTGPVEFVGSQMGVISPLLWAGMLWALLESTRLGFRQRQPEHLLLSLTSLPILLLFLVLSLQTKVQANWAAPAYWSGFISAAAVFDKRYLAARARGGGRSWRSLVLVTLLTAALPTLLAYDTRLLYRLGFPPRLDPTVRLQGWRELGERVSAYREEISASQQAFIFSDRYQIASELAFYVRGQPRVYCVNLGRRMNQYDLWEGFLGLRGQDAIYVKQGNRKAEPEVRRAFARVVKEPPLPIYCGGVRVRRYSIFKCYGYRGIEIRRPKGTY